MSDRNQIFTCKQNLCSEPCYKIVPSGGILNKSCNFKTERATDWKKTDKYQISEKQKPLSESEKSDQIFNFLFNEPKNVPGTNENGLYQWQQDFIDSLKEHPESETIKLQHGYRSKEEHDRLDQWEKDLNDLFKKRGPVSKLYLFGSKEEMEEHIKKHVPPGKEEPKTASHGEDTLFDILLKSGMICEESPKLYPRADRPEVFTLNMKDCITPDLEEMIRVFGEINKTPNCAKCGYRVEESRNEDGEMCKYIMCDAQGLNDCCDDAEGNRGVYNSKQCQSLYSPKSVISDIVDNIDRVDATEEKYKQLIDACEFAIRSGCNVFTIGDRSVSRKRIVAALEALEKATSTD